MGFKKLNNLAGWLVFFIASSVYFLTMEPTASWWDCGEFIATAYKLQVGHPPGAPLFQMIGRFFSLFAFGDTSKVALMVNIMSSLSSGFTIMFLFWTITLLARKFMMQGENENSKAQQYAVLGAGLVGSLAYTFTDSFWFSAVEGEVYAMSSFFTAVVFWAILKWEQKADEPHSLKWLLLIAYLIGLSIGVHMLNLLAIPAIVYVYYFKRYKVTTKGFIIAGLLSVGILGFIMSVIIPQVVNLASISEIFFVNTLGLPFNSGTIFFFIAITALISFGIIYSQRKSKVLLNSIVLAFTFILIGYSSFMMIVIRSQANTPINENEPSDAVSLLAYLNREQYGDWPLLYGHYYSAPVVDYADGSPVYIKDKNKGRYVITDYRRSTKPVYDERFMTIFPRMYSNLKPSHAEMYKQYGGGQGVPIRITKPDGSTEVVYKPTFGQNLKFFFTYQLNHMYFRYFMWNFVGRQNDVESQGEIEHGNWISGINFIDSMRLGDQSNLPASKQTPFRTTFFFLPLILGLIGMFYHLKKHIHDTWIVFLLFILTGIAIIVYLNQYPYQPRERDYAYVGSFYAFAIWIGFGVLALFDYFKKIFRQQTMLAIVVSLVSLIAVPTLMAAQGWEAHNRSGRYSAPDYAKSYMAQCEPNAIIFTNGDNDTFPLWYVQEVEGFRTDMRVVNYMLSAGDWYVHQMGKKVYESDPLPFLLRPDQYNKGVNEGIPVLERLEGPVELSEAIAFIADDRDQSKIPLQSGERINYLPTRKLKITVDKEAVIRSGTVPASMHHLIVDEIVWEVKQSILYKNDLMLLDLIAHNNWERPIYFANPYSVNKVFDVDRYCHMEGVVYRFMPVEAAEYYRNMGGVYTEGSYDLLVNKANWGRLHEKGVTVDRESYRNSALAKQSYMRLAQALLNEGKADSAIVALDRSIELFPHEKITYDFYMLPWADIYYEAGAVEKSEKILRQLADRYIEDFDYYNRLKDKFAKYYEADMQEALVIVNRIAEMAKDLGFTTMQKELEDYVNTNLEFLQFR